MKKILITALLALPLGLSAQPKYNGEPFTKIAISGGFDAKISHGESCDVSLKIPERFNDFVEMKVRDGRLTVHVTDTNNLKRRETARLNLHITLPSLEELELSDAVHTKAKGQFAQEDFLLRMTGATDLAGLDVVATNTLKIDLSVACDFIKSKVQAKDLSVVMTGAADAEFEVLTSQRVSVDVMSAADLNILGSSLCDFVSIKTSGSADMNIYELRAKDSEVNVNGVGEIYAPYITNNISVNGLGRYNDKKKPVKTDIRKYWK